jgi:hypothetical protein
MQFFPGPGTLLDFSLFKEVVNEHSNERNLLVWWYLLAVCPFNLFSYTTVLSFPRLVDSVTKSPPFKQRDIVTTFTKYHS